MADNENGTQTETGGAPDYKALYEAAQAEAERWKSQSRKNEQRAKGNAEAARSLEEATQQLADISGRLAAIEDENATLKAAATRAELVGKVSKATGVPEELVASLAASDEQGLTEAATAIAEAYRPGGAPAASEAGTGVSLETKTRDKAKAFGDAIAAALGS